MSIQYHVYKNNSLGGPVDYSTVVATVSSTSYTPAALPVSSDTTFAVRAFDSVTGYEESNVVATFRIVLDASGNDVTGRPAAPTGLSATPLAGGTLRVRWRYLPGPTPRPTGFRVYVGTPTPDYSTPAATVPFLGGLSRYSTGPAMVRATGLSSAADPTGLADGTAYQAAVRAYNAAGEEANAAAVNAVGNAAAPAPVDAVDAVAVP